MLTQVYFAAKGTPQPTDKQCKAWSAKEGLHAASCSDSLAAVCVLDQTEKIVFPDPEKDIRIVVESNSVKFVKISDSLGWKANYSVHLWPKENNSRR